MRFHNSRLTYIMTFLIVFCFCCMTQKKVYGLSFMTVAQVDYDTKKPGFIKNPLEISPEVALKNAKDTVPPIFNKMFNLYALVGEDIDYHKGIIVKDNSHGRIFIQVDKRSVKSSEAGRYPIIYTAIDSNGNKTQTINYITFCETEPEKVFDAVDSILSQIFTPGMSQVQKAKKIYQWVRGNIGYVNLKTQPDIITAVYDGLRKKSGDCFTYYSVAEILLTRAKIVNQQIKRSEIRYGKHFWNLVNFGTGWYHFDTTPFYKKGFRDTCIFTEADAQRLTKERGEFCYVYDNSLYPAVVFDIPISIN